ncbi:MAG: hypothetical protein V7K35_19430 [Nostoc sp.]|uniref:hypothetical protein n=1 Tax=Nostoc sp. TaxID=1180 RepID=UPI002FF9E5DD
MSDRTFSHSTIVAIADASYKIRRSHSYLIVIAAIAFTKTQQAIALQDPQLR